MGDQTNGEEFVKAVRDEVKTTYEALDKKYGDLADMIRVAEGKLAEKASTSDIESRMKDVQAEIKKFEERADQIERKANRERSGEIERKSIGERFTEADEWKTMTARRTGTAVMELKEIFSPASATARTPLQTVTRLPGIIREPERPLMVRDLLPVGRVGSMTIEFPQEDVFTNGAATVAEGALKPQSNITFKAAKSDVVTIAHWLPASKQVLDDNAFLMSYIDGRLRDGLMQEEEDQIMNGSGATGNLLGLVPQATDFVMPSGLVMPATPNQFDRIRAAKLQVRQSYYAADAIVLNPVDWANMEVLKDADGNYLHAAVTSGATPRIWGMRVVESDSLAPGEFLVGAFGIAAQIWDREQANVMVSTEDRDNFVRNMVTVRAEERLALTVYRPKAFVTGSLSAA